MLNKSANNYGIAFLSSSGHGSNLITTKIFLRGTAQPAYDVKQSNLFSSKRWPCLSCLVIILLMHLYQTYNDRFLPKRLLRVQLMPFANHVVLRFKLGTAMNTSFAQLQVDLVFDSRSLLTKQHSYNILALPYSD